MKKITFLLLSLFFSLQLFSQFKLEGELKDSDGKAIPFAFIKVKNFGMNLQSNSDGKFSIRNLKPGNYLLAFSAISYQTDVDSVAITKDTFLVFTLQKSEQIMDEFIVEATRVKNTQGIAYSIITKEELQKQNLGQDIPYLLANQTSVVSTSDAGNGIGYTGMRIRGTDASRINVTVNGIPVNDAESQGTFWVDFPDLASSTQSIQIQRGVGTSTNGAGAFGGTVNILTNTISNHPYAEVVTSGGSFNSLRNSIIASTGLLEDHWVLDARASRIYSDGFIDRAKSQLYSWFFSGAYYAKKSSLKLVAYSGTEKTYQSWWGVPEAKWKNQGKDSLLNYLYNNIIPFTNEDSLNLFNSNNNTYNIYNYANQTDNYKQSNYQLHFLHQLNQSWNLQLAAHYTKGKGYYEEYKREQSLTTYGIKEVIIGSDTISTSDLIRRKWMDNDFVGIIYSINYNPSTNFDFTLGGGYNQYFGRFFNEVIWSRYASNSEINTIYYRDTSNKKDFNTYAKFNYRPIKHLWLFADLQYRNVNYTFTGISSLLADSIQTKTFHFINPKFGVNYDFNLISSAYCSFAIANREPSRSDFTENRYTKLPLHETLYDIEAGYRYRSRRLTFNGNLYAMFYKNQLVLTGELNDVGNPRRTNVSDSYRKGIELESAAFLNSYFDLQANITLSKNEIKHFESIVANYDVSDLVDTFKYKNTCISFAPQLIAGLNLVFHPLKNIDIALIHKFVGKQFLDNTSDERKSLNSYHVEDLRFSYTCKLKGLKEVSLNLTCYNIFNFNYSSNGYTYNWIAGGREWYFNHYYPQAGTNFLAGLNLRF